MSTGRDRRLPAPEGGARHYVFLCLTALLAVALVLLLRGQQTWCLLPALVGGVALALRLRIGPLLFLAVLGWQLYSQWLGQSPIAVLVVLIDSVMEMFDPWHRSIFRLRPWAPAPAFAWVDLLLAPAVLAFVAGYYRLQGLRLSIFPPDPRRRKTPPGGRGGPVVRQQRAGRLATGAEVVTLVMALPAWVAAGFLLWLWLARRRDVLGLPEALYRGLALTWLLGVALLITFAVLSYLGQRRMRPDEAEICLQDALWQETRSEQRLVGRWLARARRRQRRKEER